VILGHPQALHLCYAHITPPADIRLKFREVVGKPTDTRFTEIFGKCLGTWAATEAQKLCWAGELATPSQVIVVFPPVLVVFPPVLVCRADVALPHPAANSVSETAMAMANMCDRQLRRGPCFLPLTFELIPSLTRMLMLRSLPR